MRINTLVDVISVPKACAHHEYLPIDRNFVRIFLLVSVFFSWAPYLLLIGGRGGIKKASASTLSVNEPTRASF